MTTDTRTLAEGRWFTFSLLEQLGNIGSEVHRTLRAQDDRIKFDFAVIRALELFDLTLRDPRWIEKKRLKEIARARELFCAAVLGSTEYSTTLEDLDKYFLQYALAARANR